MNASKQDRITPSGSSARSRASGIEVSCSGRLATRSEADRSSTTSRSLSVPSAENRPCCKQIPAGRNWSTRATSAPKSNAASNSYPAAPADHTASRVRAGAACICLAVSGLQPADNTAGNPVIPAVYAERNDSQVAATSAAQFGRQSTTSHAARPLRPTADRSRCGFKATSRADTACQSGLAF